MGHQGSRERRGASYPSHPGTRRPETLAHDTGAGRFARSPRSEQTVTVPPSYRSCSAALTAGAEEGRPAALDDASHRAAAAHAPLTGAAVDAGLELELAGGTVGVAEIAQG